jgi:hypothetical protein
MRVDKCNVEPIVSYLSSEDKVPSHAIRMFVIGESTVTPLPRSDWCKLGVCLFVLHADIYTFLYISFPPPVALFCLFVLLRICTRCAI